MPKPLNLIVACAENRVIGRAGRLPWRIPEDWEFFRRQTAGQTVILGRISFDSWKSIMAEERRVIVLTHRPLAASAGPQTHPSNIPPPVAAASLPAALALAENLPGEIYICGGQKIFEEAIALPQAARLYLTLVHAHVDGDRFFPEWRHLFARVVGRRESADENFRYTFLVLGK